MVYVKINPSILRQLREQKYERWMLAEKKFPKLHDWASGSAQPTLRQAEELAKRFNIAFGYLFASSLPEVHYPVPHFRTNEQKEFRPSEELIDVLNDIQYRQTVAKELRILWGQTVDLPQASLHDNPTDVAKILRKLLKLKSDWASEQVSWKSAFSFLIRKTEEAGVFVAASGICGSNTRRRLDPKEFRGFVLYDPVAPFVFVNSNDFDSAKIFTLMHEWVHLLLRQSASFDLANLLSSQNEVERFCNQCAAEFLVPRTLLEKEAIGSIDVPRLAKKFRVSRIVIARRLLDIGKISKNDFFNIYEEYKSLELKKGSGGGGGLNSLISRVGRSFFLLLAQSARNDLLLYRDAFRISGIRASAFFSIEQKIA